MIRRAATFRAGARSNHVIAEGSSSLNLVCVFDEQVPHWAHDSTDRVSLSRPGLPTFQAAADEWRGRAPNRSYLSGVVITI
jgi:hypothetical protein